MMTCAGPGGGIEPGTAETGAGTVSTLAVHLALGLRNRMPQYRDGTTDVLGASREQTRTQED